MLPPSLQGPYRPSKPSRRRPKKEQPLPNRPWIGADGFPLDRSGIIVEELAYGIIARRLSDVKSKGEDKPDEPTSPIPPV